jgi:hypothetical protein
MEVGMEAGSDLAVTNSCKVLMTLFNESKHLLIKSNSNKKR